MDNINYLIDQLKELDLFQKIDNLTISQLEKYETLYSVRFDGFGQRILDYIYTLRISKKLNKKTILLWDTNQTTGAPIVHGLKNDDIEIYKNILIKKFDSNNEKIFKLGKRDAIKKNIFFYGKIYYFESENLRDVIIEISNLCKNLELREDIKKIVNNMAVYDYGIHSRSGDVSMTETNLGKGDFRWHTRDRLQLERSYPNEAYKKIINDLKPTKIYVGSSSEKFIDEVSILDNVRTLEKDYHQHKFIGSKKFILDVYALSKCKKLICTFSSGAALMAIYLRINSTTVSPIDFLKIRGIYKELSNVIKDQHIKLNSPKYMFKKIILVYLGRFYRLFILRYIKLLKKNLVLR